MNNEKVRKALLGAKLMDETALASAVVSAERNRVSLDRFLLEKNLVEEKILFTELAKIFGVPFIDLRTTPLQRDIVRLLPENMARRHEIIVFAQADDAVKVAMTDPDDMEALDDVAKKVQKPLLVHLTSPLALLQVFKLYYQDDLQADMDAEMDQEVAEQESPHSPTKSRFFDRQPDKTEKHDGAETQSVIRIVDQILEQAIFQNASDIHMEPRERELSIRFRIDGVLREVMTLPRTVLQPLVARIKVLSYLKLDEHRLPQDGRFMIRTENYKVAFRVSIIPVYDGEKIVLRLLNESAQVLDLEQLGMLPEPLTILRRNLSKPHGMILVTGPTGSGKTTTLYTVLNILNRPGVNIVTIEDPIEYRISRINQSQVQPHIGYSFANGLRSLLRQDPDIIMVGEIRDNETAEISVHAAMTGHLLLSTLHTNDAAGALPRLNEMGVPSFLIASTTNLVIAQRLVRRLCDSCKAPYTLKKADIVQLEKQLNFTALLQTIKDHDDSVDNELRFYKAVGCDKCSREGYQGRVGIYELLEISSDIAQLILDNASGIEIKKQASKNGMLSMIQDGCIKARKGITSLEEVLRVTKE